MKIMSHIYTYIVNCILNICKYIIDCILNVCEYIMAFLFAVFMMSLCYPIIVPFIIYYPFTIPIFMFVIPL